MKGTVCEVCRFGQVNGLGVQMLCLVQAGRGFRFTDANETRYCKLYTRKEILLFYVECFTEE